MLLETLPYMIGKPREYGLDIITGGHRRHPRLDGGFFEWLGPHLNIYIYIYTYIYYTSIYV